MKISKEMAEQFTPLMWETMEDEALKFMGRMFAALKDFAGTKDTDIPEMTESLKAARDNFSQNVDAILKIIAEETT